MKRIPRALLFSAIALALASAVSVRAQKTTSRAGILVNRGRPQSIESDPALGELMRALGDRGWVEGKNLDVVWRFSGGRQEVLEAQATELAGLELDVIVTGGGTPPVLAVQKATKKIPVVFTTVGDPVGNGIVSSLAKPGGNITGAALLLNDTTTKQMEMLKAVVPGLQRVAAFVDGGNPASAKLLAGVKRAAESMGLVLRPYNVRTREDIERAFGGMEKERVQAFISFAGTFLNQQRDLIAGLALKHRLPSAGGHDVFAEAGGLLSYGMNMRENYRLAARYVDKILKGAKVADLPVEQPTRLYMVINKKTAKALGLEIPPELLLMADRIIE